MEGPKGDVHCLGEWEAKKWIDVSESNFKAQSSPQPSIPDLAVPVPRFRSDADALKALTSAEQPPLVLCWAKGSLSARYIHWESGNCNGSHRQESSNYREADNLVSKLEDLCKAGLLAGEDLFLFTDNSVSEGTFYKGHSKSRKLNEIILRLCKVERESGAIFHVIHIAGTCKKASRIDGLSPSNMMEGMIRSGDDPMTNVPLKESADERSGGMVSIWVNSR